MLFRGASYQEVIPPAGGEDVHGPGVVHPSTVIGKDCARSSGGEHHAQPLHLPPTPHRPKEELFLLELSTGATI